MIESFVITLREGVEAALVVCLALSYLRKIDRPDLRKSLGWGVLLAAFLSLAGGVGIKLAKLEDRIDGVPEGIALLVSCGLVTWLVFWMWRHGKRMKEETEKRLGRAAGGSKSGVFLFAFLMVLREGVETVLMLLTSGFTTQGALSAAGAAAGLVLAVGLGVAFYRGTLQVDLRKFFSVTSVLLLLFAFQLLVAGLHEFTEAKLIPSGETYMRIVGPLVKHSSLFVIAVLILPFILMLRRAVSREAVPVNPAEERKERARTRGERIAKSVFATLGILVIGTLGYAWAHEKAMMVLTDPEIIFEAAPEIAVPLERVADGRLHRFAVKAEGKLLRFLVMRKEKGEIAATMDACTICNDWGYAQIGEQLRCLNCAAEINAPTFGEEGGCNPIPIDRRKTEVRGGALVIKLEAMTAHASYFRTGVRFLRKCEGCGMEMDLEKAAGQKDGKWYCGMEKCLEKLRGK
jgi:high-affinity iron transporter